ncbi:MAG: hypothetical protein MJH11_08850, partial [Lentisphaeria bacterium]|nr:hypothetical protein [Lentisphaeria bacterium]
ERCAIVEGTYEQKKLKLPRSGLLEQIHPALIVERSQVLSTNKVVFAQRAARTKARDVRRLEIWNTYSG